MAKHPCKSSGKPCTSLSRRPSERRICLTTTNPLSAPLSSLSVRSSAEFYTSKNADCGQHRRPRMAKNRGFWTTVCANSAIFKVPSMNIEPMNELQEQIFDVIASLLEGKSFRVSVSKGAIRYGFLNYIARFSLSKNYYYATPRASAHIKDKKLLTEDGLRRGTKSRRSGFTYEHAIPVNVIGKAILDYQSDLDKVREILQGTDIVSILTTEEDNLLSGPLRSQMPEGWTILESDPYARYREAHLSSIDEMEKICVYGAITR